MSSVADFTNINFIKQIESKNKFIAIEELASVFKESTICSDLNALVKALKEREEIMSTGIGMGIAIPHAKIGSTKEMAFAIGLSKEGIDFDSMDNKPVHLIILVAAGEKQHKEYLRLLSNIMSILKQNNVIDTIINSDSPEDIIEIFKTGNII